MGTFGKFVIGALMLALGLAGLGMTLCGGFFTAVGVVTGATSMLATSASALLFGLLFIFLAIKYFRRSKSPVDDLAGAPQAVDPAAPRPPIEELSGVDRAMLGTCPNCGKAVRLDAAECAHCGALFGANSHWQIVPMAPDGHTR